LEPEHRRHLVRLLLAWPAVRKRYRLKSVLVVLQRCPPSSRQAHEASAVESFRLHGQPGVEEDLEPRPSRVRTSHPSTRHLRIFFFNDTATTEIYTLSLHDALPI